VKKYSFGLLELEMADLEHFWRKTPLGPLGVKYSLLLVFNPFHNITWPNDKVECGMWDNL
jgi:hypothetical protein